MHVTHAMDCILLLLLRLGADLRKASTQLSYMCYSYLM
jgi:hypothetical protein